MEYNFENHIKCICGKIYEISEFKTHFKLCKPFKECYASFDDKLSNLIKKHSKPKEQLLLIRFLFGQYVKILDKKINGNYVEISKAFNEDNFNSSENNQYNNGY